MGNRVAWEKSAESCYGRGGAVRWQPGRPGGWGSDGEPGRGWVRMLLRLALPVCLLLAPLSPCGAQQAEYHTPLAGEPGRVTFLGRSVEIPAVNRADMTSITVGASALAPAQGQSPVIPVAAFYHRRITDQSYRRALVAVFVNELEYDRDLGGWDLVAQFENDTLPVAGRELRRGEEVRGTSLYYGTLLGSLGVGWRLPVAPFQADNDLRVQMVGRGGYFYAHRESDSAPGLWVPPNTALYGARLRCRYDGLRRNLLELPHQGLAAGFDVDYLHRDRWRAQTGGDDDRDYL